MGGSLTEASDCGFSSGHDLRVLEFEPCVMLCAGSAEPAWDSLSPFLSPAPLHVLSLSLSKINKETLKKSLIFFFLSLFILRESQAGSALPAQSPVWGLNPQTMRS